MIDRDPMRGELTVPEGVKQAIWLRAEGGCAVVLVEDRGKWIEIIREPLDAPFSHIKEPS